MNTIDQRARNIAIAVTLITAIPQAAQSDEFTDADLARWKQEYLTVVDQGEQLFHGGLQSKNTVSCDQCHPNAANTHPETYPKFQKQLGKVAVLGEMINWCIQNPLESEPLALDDPRMIALQAYITEQRRKVPLDPGTH
ncbi:MAG: cytochrome C [Gammaproteobacteria bacterium]